MKYNTLGRTGIKISEICLGTMTWGSQNTEAEAHEQMDYAISQGINFFDTAELYPVTPAIAETQGDTERFIGTWFKKSGKRKDIVLATKVSGPGRPWIRNGAALSRKEINHALEMSLERLQTDYIDLYQLHWTNRGIYSFRGNWAFNPFTHDKQKSLDDLHVILETLGDLVKKGVIRAIGVSNDSAWGVLQYMKIAEEKGLPRMSSIQNEYNLLCRLFDTDLAEISHHEDIGLLAYSPLAAGLLSGKYQNGNVPKGSRGDINPDLHGRMTRWQEPAVAAYCEIAKKHGLDVSAMSLAFLLTRPFMASVIIGATTMEQLKINISAKDVVITPEIAKEIHAVYRQYPMPI